MKLKLEAGRPTIHSLSFYCQVHFFSVESKKGKFVKNGNPQSQCTAGWLAGTVSSGMVSRGVRKLICKGL